MNTRGMDRLEKERRALEKRGLDGQTIDDFLADSWGMNQRKKIVSESPPLSLAQVIELHSRSK